MAEAQERLKTENGGSGGTLHNFAQSAPIVAEVLAVQRGMAIAEATGSPIYILHVSSGRALKRSMFWVRRTSGSISSERRVR